jgi:hypothetical protein
VGISPSPSIAYALRFISGKYQGGELPLLMEREITIGRSSDLDMVLVEDMVSRKHARITTWGGQIVLEDLGSTNGTFVNGERIQRVQLREGDRVLVGTSIIKLVIADTAQPSRPLPPDGRSRPEQEAQRRPTMMLGRAMTGKLDEVPLPDLLQVLSSTKRSGVLGVRSSEGVGQIYLRQGQIYYASIDDGFELRPRKALCRLLGWEQGTFELGGPDDRAFLDEIGEPTDTLLQEARRELSGLRRLEGELPLRTCMLRLEVPLSPPLRDLSPAELDVLQLVINHGQLGTVLDRSPLSDSETGGHMLALIRRRYVMPQ